MLSTTIGMLVLAAWTAAVQARPSVMYWSLTSDQRGSSIDVAFSAVKQKAEPKLPAADPWQVISVEEPKSEQLPSAVIRFRNGFSFKPGLFRAAVVGRLPSLGRAPFLVVEGSGCMECDMTARGVYIGDPTAWPSDVNRSKGLWFSGYPTRNYSQTSRKLMSWSRLFVGQCLNNKRSGAISFSAERDTKSWQRTVVWAYANGDRLSAYSGAVGGTGVPSLAIVLQFVRSGTCREIPAQVTDEGDIG